MISAGTTVKITSKESKYKGAIGVVIGYCKGQYSNICRVKISDRVTVNLFDNGVEECKQI